MICFFLLPVRLTIQKLLRYTLVMFLLGLVSACGLFGGNERPAYQGAEYYKNLEVPPDLTRPDDRDVVKIPEPDKEALERFIVNNKLATVITPKFKGIRVVNFAGFSWLEVDATAEKIWPELIRFWEHEGIKIIDEQPLLGYMETEWVERKDRDAGFFTSILQRFEPDQKDKFRLRVERIAGEPRTRIFISHRAIEREVRGEYADEFTWVTLPADIERERELVARLALYAGLSEEQRQQLAETYHSYAQLVTLSSDNSVSLTMKGSPEFVHHRALRALDRLGLKDVSEDESGTIHFVLGKLSDESLNIEEDELSKTSWLMQLFKDDKDALSNSKARQLKLVFSREQDSVRIDILDEAGNIETDEDGNVTGSALIEQFRNLFAQKLE